MITLQNKKNKKIIKRSKKDADIILASALGHNYKILSEDKTEAPPEAKVSVKKK